MRLEAIPSLQPVPGIDLDRYTEQLIERFSNAEVRDTLARINSFTSDRIPKFLLPVLRYQLDAGGPIDRCAAVVAIWARYAEAVDEDGEPIDVVDHLRDRLLAAAAEQRKRPLAFLEQRDLFGDLADDDRFTATYTRLLDSLHERGVRATLQSLG
jgi:mannitol 2-dehydrogenase